MAASATGCYKCGRPGHWSSQCPSQPASENGEGAQGETHGYTQGYKRKEPWAESRSGSFVPRERHVKMAAPPRRMPKLTPDLLLGTDGLGYVLEKIPRQVTIKGHGHEVEDLKSLLEAYVRWHQTLLPYYSYSQFVEKVEKVGSTKRVRMCVRELRLRVDRGENPMSNDPESGFELGCEGDDAPDTRSEEYYDSDAAEDHAGPPVDVDVDVVEEQPSTQTDAAPAPSCRPTLVIGQEVSAGSQQQEIKEEQRARMEANKQKALERARARKLELEKVAAGTISPAQ